MNLRFALFLPLATGLPVLALSATPSGDALRRLPLRFEANAGQWNPAVRYAARAGGYQLFLTNRQAVVTLEGRTLGIALDNANRAPKISASEPLAARTNYLVGARSQWRTGVAQYGRVRYAAVYPGIDLVYYGNGTQLEYDFVLQPKADPSRIRMKFSGADRISLSPQGDLVMESGEARFVQKKPYIYQQDATGARRQLAGNYRMLGRHTVGLEVAAWDRTRPLTIDPVLSYSTLIGGGGSDAINAVQVDRTGLVYVAGYLNNNDVTGTDDAFRASSSGSSDGFLAILNPALSGSDSLVYLTYLGGSGADQINAMALDGAGNVYLAGSTASSDFPLAGVNVKASFSGGDSDGFVLKLSPRLGGAQSLVYGSYLGGSAVDVAYAVGVDNTGLIYVAGTTQSTDYPLTGTGYAQALYGGQDAFLSVINPDSSSPLVYSTYFGGELGDDGRALAVGTGGIVYLGGSTISTQLPQAGAMYQDQLAGSADLFLAKFDITNLGANSLVYSTYIGGGDLEELRGLALDADGKVLLTGYTLSTDFPVTRNGYRSTPGGNGDAFLIRFDTSAPRILALTYSTFFGGSDGEVGYAVIPGLSGTAWITGYTLSLNLPTAGTPLQSINYGGVEVFLANFDLNQSGDASLVYSTYLGNTGVHVGNALALGSDGSIYVAGYTGAKSVPPTGSAYQAGYGGGLSDGFVSVIKP